ncbi:MAG: hypothetical protein O3A96_07265, partial [Proteobacteria bacterium]|nr:hypothetical protein [Pseudomonadota bacterium]
MQPGEALGHQAAAGRLVPAPAAVGETARHQTAARIDHVELGVLAHIHRRLAPRQQAGLVRIGQRIAGQHINQQTKL